MPDFGIDLSTHYTDPPDLSFRQISGKRAIAEAVARRWTTERGQLVTDPDAGFDLQSLLGAAVDQTALYAVAEAMQAEAEKDERVARCGVVLTYDPSTKTLTTSGYIDPASGDPAFEFVFVLSASNVTKLTVK